MPRSAWTVGQCLDVFDAEGKRYDGVVRQVRGVRALVTWTRWGTMCNRWFGRAGTELRLRGDSRRRYWPDHMIKRREPDGARTAVRLEPLTDEGRRMLEIQAQHPGSCACIACRGEGLP